MSFKRTPRSPSQPRLRVKVGCVVLSILVAGLIYDCDSRAAQISSIRNETLQVRYDGDSGRFSATARRSGEAFVTEGQLEAVRGSSRVESVRDPVFGPGQSIRMERADGGHWSLELYRGLPFCLIRGEI